MPSQLLVIRDVFKGHPHTVEQYLDVVNALAARAGRKTTTDDDSVIVPFVNDGRWIALCPWCRAGMAVDPDWPHVACTAAGCFRVYSQIEIPAERHAIEAVLVERLPTHRHWGYERGMALAVEDAAETVSDLEAENRDHAADLPKNRAIRAAVQRGERREQRA